MIFCVDMSMLIHQMVHRLVSNAKSDGTPMAEVPGNAINWCLDRCDKFTSQFGLNPMFEGCKWYAVFDSPERGKTYRHIAYEPYKGNRTKDPVVSDSEDAVREAFEQSDEWISVVSPSIVESDDVIASLAAQHKGNVVIHTEDTDYHQLLEPKRVVILKKSNTPKANRPMKLVWFNYEDMVGKFDVTPNYWPRYQAIVGKDNVESWEGVGPKAATRVLTWNSDLSVLDVESEQLGLRKNQRESYERFRAKVDLLIDLHTLRKDLIV